MNFEPQKFFIGLMDFFSILLPGALLTYLLMDPLGPLVLGQSKYRNLGGAQALAVFLAASYLAGHLLFLIGSWLDEFPYDWLRRRYTLNKQIALLARRGKLLRWYTRVLIWTVFKQERDLAVERAGKIKAQMLKDLHAGNAVNTFQWSKVFLAKEHPESLATVQRFEADSKFFRSFAVVLVVLFAASAWQHEWLTAALCAALIPPALWRYMEQRYKATNQAYWAVIGLGAQGGKLVLEQEPPLAGSPTHAGGVVFRMRRGQARYLLVEAKDDARQWVLPKGHIEEAEPARETAVREVHEETGVWAGIRAELSRVSYSVAGNAITVQFFLMEFLGHGLRSDVNREHRWLPLADAKRLANYLETRELLRSAEQQIQRLYPPRKTLWSGGLQCLRRARRIRKLIFTGRAPKPEGQA